MSSGANDDTGNPARSLEIKYEVIPIPRKSHVRTKLFEMVIITEKEVISFIPSPTLRIRRVSWITVQYMGKYRFATVPSRPVCVRRSQYDGPVKGMNKRLHTAVARRSTSISDKNEKLNTGDGDDRLVRTGQQRGAVTILGGIRIPTIISWRITSPVSNHDTASPQSIERIVGIYRRMWLSPPVRKPIFQAKDESRYEKGHGPSQFKDRLSLNVDGRHLVWSSVNMIMAFSRSPKYTDLFL